MLVVALTLAFLLLFGIFLTVAGTALAGGQRSNRDEMRRIAREFRDMQERMKEHSPPGPDRMRITEEKEEER